MKKSSFLLVPIIGFALLDMHAQYLSIVVDEPDDVYDFIIVGGGTTGSVVARRLTETNIFKVLLLEAGSEYMHDPFVNIPLLTLLNRGRWVDWLFKTESTKPYSNIMKDNACDISRGKVLGGSSAINYQLYSRGSPEDYDSWSRQGAEGWDYHSVLPFFKKSEKSHHIYPVEDYYHGNDGPLKVNHMEKMGLTEAFISAAEQLGLSSIKDHNSQSIVGVSPQQTTVHRGMRQSSDKVFLYPVARSRKQHLHIVVNAHVMRINFKTGPSGRKIATGVEFTKNGVVRNITARKEVILSAGTFGTPQILMLSGIGDRMELQKHGINVVHHLPGVGRNYQDHIFFPVDFHARNLTYGDTASFKEILFSFPDWILNGRGPLGTMGMAVANFVVPKTPKTTSLPDIQALLLPAESGPLLHRIVTRSYSYSSDVFDYESAYSDRDGVLFSFFIYSILLHPKSSGTVTLRSPNPFDPPLIDPNLYSNPEDLKTMIAGIKWIIGAENTPSFKLKKAKFVNIVKQCNATVKDDSFYKCLVMSESQLYHGCCTAKVGKHEDKFAVVDPQLRVYGVDGLRLADASVMPHIISGPLQATCYMIGEKTAAMILGSYS